MRLLALGDSYTKGEGVPKEKSFPYLLTADPVVIAETGWTTADLLGALPEGLGEFDCVTLLIGVNNQYDGGELETYRKELKRLLRYGLKHGPLTVLSIPDWGGTPFAKNKEVDPKVISQEIDQFNGVLAEEVKSAGVSLIDVTTGSRKPQELTSDGLHLGESVYKNWASLILKRREVLFHE